MLFVVSKFDSEFSPMGSEYKKVWRGENGHGMGRTFLVTGVNLSSSTPLRPQRPFVPAGDSMRQPPGHGTGGRRSKRTLRWSNIEGLEGSWCHWY